MALPSNLSVASTIYDFNYARRAIHNDAFPLCRAVYFDVAELLTIITFGNGDIVLFYSVARGKVYPFRCTKIIFSSTANNAFALY